MSASMALAHGQVRPDQHLVIIAHEATGPAIQRIAHLLGHWRFAQGHTGSVRIRDTETGEANVLAGMQRERAQGHFVPAGIEGANGGVIFAQQTSRDAVTTGLLLLAGLTDRATQRVWSEAAGAGELSTLKRWADSLPAQTTILEAVVGIPSDAAPRLKIALQNRLASLFAREAHPYDSIQFRHYQDEVEKFDLHGDGQGGWIARLYRPDGFFDTLFLRPSRNEPLLRIQSATLDENRSPALFSFLHRALVASLAEIGLGSSVRLIPLKVVRHSIYASLGVAILLVLGANLGETAASFDPPVSAYPFWLANAVIPLGRVLQYQAATFPVAVAFHWAAQKWAGAGSLSVIPSLLLLAGWLASQEHTFHWEPGQWGVVLTLWNPEWIVGIAVPILMLNALSVFRSGSQDIPIARKAYIRQLALIFLAYGLFAMPIEWAAQKTRDWLGTGPTRSMNRYGMASL